MIVKFVAFMTVSCAAILFALKYNSYLYELQEHIGEVGATRLVRRQKKINVAISAVSLVVMCTVFIRARDIFYSTTVVVCFWSMLLLCVTFRLKGTQMIKWSRFTLAAILAMLIKLFGTFLLICL